MASITARVTLCERAAAATEAVDDLKAEIDDAEESHTSIEQRAGKQLIKYGKGKKMEELWQGWDTVQMMGSNLNAGPTPEWTLMVHPWTPVLHTPPRVLPTAPHRTTMASST